MLSPKKEKKFLESCMTLIHYSHDQDSFFTKCKIRIICIIIFLSASSVGLFFFMASILIIILESTPHLI